MSKLKREKPRTTVGMGGVVGRLKSDQKPCLIIFTTLWNQ